MKKTIPLLIVILGGLIWVAWAFSPHYVLQEVFYNQFYLPWAYASSSFAMLLGVLSLTMMHSAKIKRRAPKWQYSYFFFASFIITCLAGFIGGIQKGSLFMWMFENVQMPMSATMFSLLAFYMATAAYKAFRARSPEATVLLLAAIVVMLAQVPLGVQISKHLPTISQWILDVPNLASKRGIMLGVGLGSVATSLKILLGIERSYLGGGD
ncbi:MAG: hypothetical protein PHY41_02300 [Candidatus Cloacimonetes bacterium]|jgi:hypothetical protein|nr:hypothetical protein [Candidatus Cloacimonadota bacterium]MDY0299570.1 hypothetical protein [Candidatus Cloacimonadaceae bacterium]MCB5279253.1 hypothetical protein [Candidatus Cloacimonadota bacterium]MCK9332551.1 hypothetical protein [Candidatus Cloacimonadota bacterium]MDD2211002.1 hypothetical protein [Candidatus Cloacimonadota bacterium]